MFQDRPAPVKRRLAAPNWFASEPKTGKVPRMEVAGDERFITPAAEPRVTCPRCGNFVASVLDAPLGVCRECAKRVLIEPLRGPLTAASATHAIASLWWSIGPIAFMVTLAFELPGFVLFTTLPELPHLFQTLYGLFTLIGEIAVMWMANEALHGRNVSLSEAFSRSLPRYGAVFSARWTSGIRTLGWLLLLILPGIYKGTTYSLAQPIALFEDIDGSSAADRSAVRATPHVWSMMGLYAMLICAAVLWSVGPLLLIGLTSPDLEAETPWPLELVLQIGVSIATLTATFVASVFYAKTAVDEALDE